MQIIEIAFRILLGAAGGAFFGVLLGRAKLCSASHCKHKAKLTLTVLAGAAFGAAVAWSLIRPADIPH